MMLQQKFAFIFNSEIGESIIQFMNERYSIPFHLSEQKVFLSFSTMAMRKSLSQKITDKINRMYVNNCNIKLI